MDMESTPVLSTIRSDELRDLPTLRSGKDQFSAACGGELENRRTFAERESVENSPECNEGELSFDSDSVSAKTLKYLKQALIEKMGNVKRVGWYFQQLIKLYSHRIIDGLLDKHLILDADIIFIKPVHFFNEENKTNFSFSEQYFSDYFIHMEKLHPSLKKVLPTHSGICDHMMFERKYLIELFNLVEDHSKKPFYEIFIENIDPNLYHDIGSGASEFEIYFNYMLTYHPEVVSLRKLNTTNITRRELDGFLENIDSLSSHSEEDKNEYHYISSHHWLG
jgi:hypothetical protein